MSQGTYIELGKDKDVFGKQDTMVLQTQTTMEKEKPERAMTTATQAQIVNSVD